MILSQHQRLLGLSPALAQRAVALRVALDENRLDDADRDGRLAYAASPTHPEILHLVGRLQYLRGHYEPALALLHQARIVRSNDALIYSDLGATYEALNDFERARHAYRLACETGPEYPSCWFNLGRRLMRDGDSDAAVAALKRAVEIEPQHPPARAMLAAALQADGRAADAQAAYRRITATTVRGSGGAWSGLATLKPMPLDAADIESMSALLRGDQLSDADRMSIGFALAMAYEHSGDFPHALDALRSAHAIARRAERYDAAAFSRYLDSILGAFTQPVMSMHAQGEEVIFIVSLPRSGSTLVEQILGSHSQVQGATELLDLPEVLIRESDRLRQPWPAWVATRTPDDWQALGAAYLARTKKWRTQKPRFTDKSPGNWQYVGAMLAMLPNARIVVARRDPLETCFGCYRYMITEHAYAHDFDDLADHWRDFDRAVVHWRALYPDRVHEHVYERLVADPEREIRRLLDFCGLPFEAACLDFHASERRVSTPSASQVREPLRSDTARARKYGALIDPLRAALHLPQFDAS